MSAAHDHEHQHDHTHGHGHGHGHENDQGVAAMLRYLRMAPRMWTSEVNDAVVDRLAPRPGETVMDIGAGMGAGSIVAARSGCSVIAVEPTPYMRRILGLRARLKRLGGRIRIVNGAAEATGADGQSIDAAFAVNTVHHWVDLEAGIRELARVLAPGGRVLLVDEDFEDPAHPEYETVGARRHAQDEDGADSDDGHSHHFHTADPDEVAAAMRAAGLSVVSAAKDSIVGRPAVIVEAVAPSA